MSIRTWLAVVVLAYGLVCPLFAQTSETIAPGVPFNVEADHQDAIDPSTNQPVPVDGFRLRQNGAVAYTLPFSARQQGHLIFAFSNGWQAGVYDILVTAYNATTEAPVSTAPANIRLTVGTPPPPPPQAQCADGLDNDKDGLIDLADPGCASASDTDETNTPPPPPPPTGCGWAVSPVTLTVPAAGGSFNGSLTAATTCAWSVYSTSAWIVVGSTTKGTGSGTLPFTVTANTATVGRAGNLIIVNAATGSMATNIAVHQVAGGGTPPPPPPLAQCGDKLDNDKDGLTDFPNDPGCSSATDPDEFNAPPPPTAQPLTATVGLANCPLTLSQNAPDATTGWRVQFSVDAVAFGALDTTAPYSVTGMTRPGAHQWASVWTKVGSTLTVTTPTVAGSCQ